MNVGASSPEEYGNYYAWGETSKRYSSIAGSTVTGATFEWSNCPYHSGSSSITGWTKYIPAGCQSWAIDGNCDNLLILEAPDDIAHVSWGGTARMPDKDEMQWLIQSSRVELIWTDSYNSSGVAGCIIKGKGAFSKAFIFLPAAGKCVGDEYIPGYEHNGYYWTSEQFPYGADSSYMFLFNDMSKAVIPVNRYWGYTVRPVISIQCPL